MAIRSWPSSQALAVTDRRGNTYRKAIKLNETVDGMALAIYYAENIAGGSNVVTEPSLGVSTSSARAMSIMSWPAWALGAAPPDSDHRA